LDAAGAKELRRRLEAQRHWRRASAVRAGAQPAADPDGSDLDAFGGHVRSYGRDGDHRMVKILTDGRWETSFLQEPAESTGE